MGPTILETINQSLDQPRLKTIRFKQRGSPPQRTKNKQVKAAPVKEQPIVISAHEQKALDRITDPELKQGLHSFLIRCHREKKRG